MLTYIYIYLFIYLNVGMQKDLVRQNIEEEAVWRIENKMGSKCRQNFGTQNNSRRNEECELNFRTVVK